MTTIVNACGAQTVRRPTATSVSALPGLAIRTAMHDEAPVLHRLITENLEKGYLLPRTLSELTSHASRFLVATTESGIVGCAELAPFNRTVAEIRSFVVAEGCRRGGIGRRLILAIIEGARHERFSSLCALVHDPSLFVSLGFSIVPHVWMREKIAADCHACASFRCCSQYALQLDVGARAGRRHRVLADALKGSTWKPAGRFGGPHDATAVSLSRKA